MSTDYTRTAVGHTIESIIKATGMTKRAVSEKSGIPYSSLNAIISGYRPISLEQVLRLADATRTNPADFLPNEFFSDTNSAQVEVES